MPKIIIKNAGTCVNPILTQVQHAVSAGSGFPVGTPLLIFYIEMNTVNEPGTMEFEYSLNSGTTWTVLYTQPSVQGAFVYGYGSIPPVGTLCRVKVTNTACGTRISNSKVSSF